MKEGLIKAAGGFLLILAVSILLSMFSCTKENEKLIEEIKKDQETKKMPTKFEGFWEMDSMGLEVLDAFDTAIVYSSLTFKADSMFKVNRSTFLGTENHHKDDFQFTNDSMFWLGIKYSYKLTENTLLLVDGQMVEHFVKK
jgi:hypothetical protein